MVQMSFCETLISVLNIAVGCNDYVLSKQNCVKVKKHFFHFNTDFRMNIPFWTE